MLDLGTAGVKRIAVGLVVALIAGGLVFGLMNEARAVSVTLGTPTDTSLTTASKDVAVPVTITVPKDQRLPIDGVEVILENTGGLSTKLSPFTEASVRCDTPIQGCSTSHGTLTLTSSQGSGIVEEVTFAGTTPNLNGYGYAPCGGYCFVEHTGYGYSAQNGYGYEQPNLGGEGYELDDTAYGYGYDQGSLTLTFEVTLNLRNLISGAGNYWLTFNVDTGSQVLGDVQSSAKHLVVGPGILDTNIQQLAGAGSQTPYVEAFFSQFYQLNLRTSQFGSYDISNTPVNADTTTKYSITTWLDGDFHPRLLLGAAKVGDYDLTYHAGNDTWKASMRIQPVAQSLIQPTPLLSNWPTGAGDTADVDQAATVGLSIDEMNHVPQGQRNIFEHAVIATDAQAFGTARFQSGNASTPQISLTVGGPHFKTDGTTVNEGFFNLLLTKGIRDDWGLSSTGGLSNTFAAGNAGALQVDTSPPIQDGWWANFTITYSSGEVKVEKTSSSSPGGGGGGGGDDGSETIESGAGDPVSPDEGQEVQITRNLPAGVRNAKITFKRACTDCSVHVSRSTAPPQGSPGTPAGFRAVNFMTLEVRDADGNVLDDYVQEGTIEFEVEQSDLPGNAQPGQVVLLRDADGWRPQDTQLVSDSTDDPLVYEATLEGFSNFAVTADETPPQFTDEQPTGTTGAIKPTVSASFSDNRGIDTDTFRLTIDGINRTDSLGSLEVTDTGFSFVPASSLGEGEHTATVTLSDVSGLEGTKTWTFTIEAVCQQAPTITQVRPAEGATGVATDATIQVTVQEGDCPIQSSEITVDDANVRETYTAGVLAATLPSTVGNEETVSVTATLSDTAGNDARKTWSFTTEQAEEDTPPPTTEPTDEGGNALLFVIIALVLLAIVGVGAWYYTEQQDGGGPG